MGLGISAFGRSFVGARAGVFLVVALTIGLGAPAAGATPDPNRNPAHNFDYRDLPAACDNQPTGKACINVSVYWLDQARASLGLGPYLLPADFVSLTPAEQAFVLTDLDRTLYGRPPIGGLTSALNADAARGVQADDDPSPSDPNVGGASNWAGAFPNMPLAYLEWVYNDGPNSGNLDCTATNMSGCWGHRLTVLGDYGPGPMGMGAAAGTDPENQAGYAMLVVTGDMYSPVYTYTWEQARAAGAGTNNYNPGSSGNHWNGKRCSMAYRGWLAHHKHATAAKRKAYKRQLQRQHGCKPGSF